VRAKYATTIAQSTTEKVMGVPGLG
jgi:hypothetical protein